MSSVITIYESEYITLEYWADKKIVFHVVHKPVGGDNLRPALNLGTETLAKYGACKWLSDDRKNGPLPKEDVEWGEQDWNPRTVKAGWRYWALIVPQEVVAAGAMAPVIERLYELGLTMMCFSTVQEGIEWLDSKPNTANQPEVNSRAS